jgi:hypothetical protein
MKKPKIPPVIILFTGLLVMGQVPELHPTKKKYKNPARLPIIMPKKGFQKYHDLKNSLTDFGFGFGVLQFASIYLYIFICRCKDM